MPEIFFDTLDQVPEGLREHAKEADGKVTVNVVPKVKLDEFRDNNTKLAKERDLAVSTASKAAQLLGTEDFDAATKEITDLRSIASRVKDGQLVENKGLEAAIEERTKQMREGYDAEIKTARSEALAWKNQATTLDQRIRRGTIERAIMDVIVDETIGVDTRSAPDILSRAIGVFHVTEDGKLIAKNGDATIYGADGATPMTPKEWITTKLKEEAPYFFKGSQGGGAGGGGDTKLGGLSAAEFQKLPAEERLRIANGENRRR